MKWMRSAVFFLIISIALVTHGQTQKDYLNAISSFTLYDMRATLLRAEEHGLNYKNYWTDWMEREYLRAGSWNSNLKNQTATNFLIYLRDLSSGVVDPGIMGSEVRLTRKPFPSPKELNALLVASGYQPQNLAYRMSSQLPQYLGLKESLRKLTYFCSAKQWPSLSSSRQALRLNSRDRSLPEIKNRLRQLGYPVYSNDDLFDSSVLAAVQDIQWVLKFKPDGVISPNGMTFRYLNTSCEARIRQVRMDMEKLRWFPQNFEDRYIFVNLAMTYSTLIDKSAGLNTTTKVINGRPARRTPTMKDKIVHVVINPFWIVPPTIFKEDKVEEIKHLFPWQINEYFESRHYEVWDKNFTRRIEPSSIDWWRIGNGAEPEIYIRQKPHTGNALGSLKFVLTNSFAIYLHDTNQRELFAQANRQLSSGCVRVDQPVDLAEYLLQGTTWNRYAIESTMAKPGEVLDKDTKAPLKSPMPVYMIFLTSQLSSDGVLRFSEDSYGMNSKILQRGSW